QREERDRRSPGRPEGARIPALRAEQAGPAGGGARRQLPSAHPGHRARAAQEARLRRHSPRAQIAEGRRLNMNPIATLAATALLALGAAGAGAAGKPTPVRMSIDEDPITIRLAKS